MGGGGQSFCPLYYLIFTFLCVILDGDAQKVQEEQGLHSWRIVLPSNFMCTSLWVACSLVVFLLRQKGCNYGCVSYREEDRGVVRRWIGFRYCRRCQWEVPQSKDSAACTVVVVVALLTT